MQQARCSTCQGSSRKGLLWLGGGDWLECPDCNATGTVTFYADIFNPVERTISMAGIGSHVERRHHPSIAHLQEAVEWRSTV